MQAIGRDDPIIPVTERPGRSGLEIHLLQLAASLSKRQERRDIAVYRAYRKAGVA